MLFRRHYAALLRLGVVMLGSREAAEDAVQDAFVALHRHRRPLRDPEAAEAYLRVRGAQPLPVLGTAAGHPASHEAVDARARAPREPGGHDVVARDEVGSLVAAMRTLARRQREVLACRYVLELSVAETAQLLEISEGSVKAHTHRGLQALQQRIEVTR